MAGPSGKSIVQAQQKLRLDKWLWQARFFKSRGLACDVIEAGHCRVNGQRVTKAGQGVGCGDVLTFPQGGQIRLVRILALGERRGPAPEAQLLYFDLECRSEADSALTVLE